MPPVSLYVRRIIGAAARPGQARPRRLESDRSAAGRPRARDNAPKLDVRHETPPLLVERLASRALGETVMHYVGMDYCVDLECEACRKSTRIRYSRLLSLVTQGARITCAACGRVTSHDGTSASKARLLFQQHRNLRQPAA